jgi:microsomal dipeptidase-like Zn-dependent dipeptidase/anthranilate/para-aminobenzoate synthase component II
MTKHFDWQAQLAATAYASFPEAKDRPVIGITSNYGELTAKLAEGYYKSVWRAGGIPVIIPPISDTEVIINTLQRIDGLLLSGGADYDPHYAGEEPSPKLGEINAERDLPELLITQLAYNRQIPILGICRGIQTLAMVLGGHVAQDLSEVKDGWKEEKGIQHSQQEERPVATHNVTVEKDSVLFSLYKFTTLRVNSFHHQSVDDPGERFRITARAEDNIVEAMESTEHKSIMGVQWHPECLADGLPIFQWLIGEARQYREACRTHSRILTLDTHCDTPMFFPQNVLFDHRDTRILVDLHKMDEGRQDATIMVAYLPQNPAAGDPASHAKAYADSIFDKIENIVAGNSNYISIARTPADLWTNKREGRKSIMLGIENGRAIEGSLDNLRHFAQRGIVYMTLCHNGDNDICDSARGSQTHNGVSDFGRKVISEMNRLGIMVDLSHAAESSFYDALELSETPIVCSHSSCRALCDHPRNLTDDQMRALAQKGGVMQVTLYNGFLVKEGQATIEDALRHLEHAISIMGIDYVGLGTDFDGDGGICGLASSSELLQFTRQLLTRNYSEEDIQKIWGGNFLRVMQQVQDKKQ